MTTIKDMHTPLLAGAVMVIYGLNIPVISSYILLIAGIALLFAVTFMAEFPKPFADRLLLLVLFVSSYYLFTTLHGITGYREAIRSLLEIISAYALGFSLTLGKNRESNKTAPMVLLLLISGFIVFSLLTVYSFLQSSGLIEIVERTTISFWDGSTINAPGLGANGSLGMCLLPVLFYGISTEYKGLFFSLVAATITLMFAAGVYVNVALQNRTPFLATAASLSVGTIIYLYRHKTKTAAAVKKLTLIGLLVVAAVYFLATSIDLEQYNIFTRFTEERLGTGGRYEAWTTLLGSLHHSLLGGRTVKLEVSFVHNLWLDVIWDAGIVPCTFLTAFHLSHLSCFNRILRSELPMLVILMVFSLGISFFVNFMQEPTMTASVPYFSASCFFLGLILNLATDLKQATTEFCRD